MLKEAFEKAGLLPAHVAFAAACHDLARLALNKQPDPARAAHTWLGMASGQLFREGPLREFLAAVADERAANTSSAGVRDQKIADAQRFDALSPAGAKSDDGAVHSDDDTHAAVGSSPSGTQRERGGQPHPDAQITRAASLAPSAPTEQQRAATKAAAIRDAKIMSGVYIPDHRGGRELFDDVKIRYYSLTKERLARAVGRHSVAYNLIRIAETRLPANHEQMDGTTASRDIFTSSEIRTMQQQAAVFAGSGLISLPEELRSVVADAVEAA